MPRLRYALSDTMLCSIATSSKRNVDVVQKANDFTSKLPKTCQLSDVVFGANHIISKVAEGKRKVLLKFANAYLDHTTGMALYAVEAGRERKLLYQIGKNTILPAAMDAGFYAAGKELYTFDNELIHAHRYELKESIMTSMLSIPIINAGRQLGMLVAEGPKFGDGEPESFMSFKCCGECGPRSSEARASILLEYMSQMSAIFSNMMFNWFDRKTGLLNASAFESEFYPSMLRWKEKKQKFSVVFMDLDGFKQVNDKLGHAAGDEVLKKVANVLVEFTESNSLAKGQVNAYPDIVIRWGGDEFLIILQGVEVDAAHAIVRRIHTAISQLSHKGMKVGASSGIVDATQIGSTNGEVGHVQLIEEVDTLLYTAKRKSKEDGTGGWMAYFDHKKGAFVVER